jgi:primosomal protein N' (replication factor Y)
MQALARCDRDAFLSAELEGREAAALPPFGRLAALILSMPGEADAAQTAYEIARAAPNGEGITVWGPAPAPIGLLRGRSRWRLLVQAYRGVDMSAYLARWRAGLKLPSSARLSIDIDPYSFL